MLLLEPSTYAFWDLLAVSKALLTAKTRKAFRAKNRDRVAFYNGPFMRLPPVSSVTFFVGHGKKENGNEDDRYIIAPPNLSMKGGS